MHDKYTVGKLLSNYNLIIFDLDGVIVDSANLKIACMREALDDFDSNLVEPFLKEFSKAFGRTRQFHFKKFYNTYLGCIDNFEDFYTCYAKRYSDLLQDRYILAELCEHASETIGQLAACGAHLYVATGTVTEEAERVLRVKKLHHHFDGIFGAPLMKSYSINQILSNTQIAKQKAIMIGDATYDRNSAFENQISFLFIERHAMINRQDIAEGCNTQFFVAKTLNTTDVVHAGLGCLQVITE
jgi:phosphoglycolate phosphatase